MSLRVSSVQLRNFRGFREHNVSLEAINVLVGQNNAGKSTFIEALRLLAVAIRKIQAGPYQPLPSWLDGEAFGFGVKCSFEAVDFDFQNIHHNYSTEKPARLQAVFSNRARVTLWLNGENDNFAQLSHPQMGAITTKTEASKIELCPIQVMPPLGPLVTKEIVIAPTRVKEYMFGRLASRHFRNQLNLLIPQYRKWSAMLEDTWPGANVSSFSSDSGESGKELSLILREGPYASEVAWVGSGLQAWMQILWFLCRVDQNAFVVLDEPDVFLHADMQRKIVKLVSNGGFSQTAIATHSAEIISDIDTNAISVIRKRERYSWRPNKKLELQQVIDSLGSKYNLQFSKISNARHIALFEGDDQKYLAEIALKKSSDKYRRVMIIPSFGIGGTNNLQQAFGAAKALHVSTEDIPVTLVLDRDFRSDDEIKSITDLCTKNHLNIFVWSQKEIENYFISEDIFRGFIQHRQPSIPKADIEAVYSKALEECRQGALGAIADKINLSDKKLSASTCFKQAQTALDSLSKSRKICKIVSGKALISSLSKSSKQAWGISFSPMTICRWQRYDDVDDEIKQLLSILLNETP